MSAAWWLALRMPAADVGCVTIQANELESARIIAGHVEYLANVIGPRPSQQATALARAGSYIQEQLERFGWQAVRQPVGPQPGFYNVVAERDAERFGHRPVLVVGAHYDTVLASPGADDNASGVAVLLEVARLLPPSGNSHVRLIAFTNEEAPLGRTELRGSFVAAADSRRLGEDIQGMIALESIGYFSDEADSQRYPAWIGWAFPSAANYLAFIANPGSRSLLHRSIAAFRATASVPAEGIAVPPALVPHVRRSDHAPYWDHGYPALMISGTAEFRNPNYHAASDLPGTLDFARLSDTAMGVVSMLRCLASPPQPDT